MQSLLDNQFAPITFTVGFWECPLQTVAEAYIEWVQGLGFRVKRTELNATLPEALRRLEPLEVFSSRHLLLATNSKWTAYFDNGARGTDATSPIGHLCEVLKCRGLIARSIPHTLKKTENGSRGMYGAVVFSLHASEPKEWLNIERSISVMNDGGPWVFREQGEIQEFEHPERYQAKRIRDRFTPEMLEEYSQAIGIDLFSPNFYGREGALLELHNPKRKAGDVLTLREAQRKLGLVD